MIIFEINLSKKLLIFKQKIIFQSPVKFLFKHPVAVHSFPFSRLTHIFLDVLSHLSRLSLITFAMQVLFRTTSTRV